jgi:hypothetical protein
MAFTQSPHQEAHTSTKVTLPLWAANIDEKDSFVPEVFTKLVANASAEKLVFCALLQENKLMVSANA